MRKKIRIYNHYQDLNYLIQRAMGEASTVFASCVLLRSSIIKSKQCNHYCELSESVLLPNKSWLKRAVIRDSDASSTFSYHSIVSVAPSPKILISFYFFLAIKLNIFYPLNLNTMRLMKIGDFPIHIKHPNHIQCSDCCCCCFFFRGLIMCRRVHTPY